VVVVAVVVAVVAVIVVVVVGAPEAPRDEVVGDLSRLLEVALVGVRL